MLAISYSFSIILLLRFMALNKSFSFLIQAKTMQPIKAIAVFLLLLCVQSAAHAAGKVALVIGNGAYQNAPALPNPTNDSTDMTAMLKTLGFTVIGGNDLDYATMGARIGEFEEIARTADVTLFFYAGHGLQVNGRNYLVPINAKLERESSLQFEAIDAETVLRSMSGPGKTAIALLDACRNNPLSRSFARSLGVSRSTAVSQGLAVPSITGGGMLIGFATAPGDVAADGQGRNSPFTTALLKNIGTPGLEIQQFMTRVKADVFSLTKETQEPWHNSSLRNEVYLVAPLASPPPAPSLPTDEADWNAVKDAGSIEALDAFMETHASSRIFVALAQQKRDALQRAKNAAVLDAFLIKKKPEQPPVETGASPKVALNNEPPEPVEPKPASPPRTETGPSLQRFFEWGKAANDGNVSLALAEAPEIALMKPAKNLGRKIPTLPLAQVAKGPTLPELLNANNNLSFPDDITTNCRLDYLDRCPFLPAAFVTGLTDAMAANGMDINFHTGNYYHVQRLPGTEHYLLSNSPAFGNGDVAIVAAIVSADLEVLKTFGFHLSKQKLGVDAGDAESQILITWAAVEGDDIYMSFDAGSRCTNGARNFGFMARFSQSDLRVKWVSPVNVSDTNFRLGTAGIMAGNGGSCVDDYFYSIDKDSGKVDGRFKLPTAIERLYTTDQHLIFELYEGAAVYQ
jgi:uncharacterized caspase-like protein